MKINAFRSFDKNEHCFQKPTKEGVFEIWVYFLESDRCYLLPSDSDDIAFETEHDCIRKCNAIGD